MTSPIKALASGIFKERREFFDFYQYTASALSNIADMRGFIHINDLYRFLGRRYSMQKSDIKGLIRTLMLLGYLKIKKRGVYLI